MKTDFINRFFVEPDLIKKILIEFKMNDSNITLEEAGKAVDDFLNKKKEIQLAKKKEEIQKVFDKKICEVKSPPESLSMAQHFSERLSDTIKELKVEILKLIK